MKKRDDTAVQWDLVLPLLKGFLRLDFREMRTLRGKRGLPRMVWNLIVYVLLGLSFSVQLMGRIPLADSVFFLLTYSMMMTAFSFVIDFHAILFREDDRDILEPLPVNEMTRALAVLSHLFIYVLMITGALMLMPSILLAAGPQSHAGHGLLFFFLSLWANLITASAIVFFYQFWIRVMGPAHWRNTLTGLQTVFIVLAMLSYLFITNINGMSLLQLQTQMGPWIWLIPATGFARLLSPESANLNLLVPGLTVLSGVMLTGAVRLLRDGLPAHHVNREGRSGKRKADRTGICVSLLRNPSIKSGYTLTLALLKHDKLLLRSVLPMLVMPAAVVLFSLWQGDIDNPFYSQNIFSLSPLNAMLTFFLIVLSHSLSKAVLYSADWEAGWIFSAAPVSTKHLFLGVWLALVLRILLPLFLCIAMLLAMALPMHHAWMHTGTLLQLSLLVFTFFVFRLKEPPFSQKRIRAEGMQRFTVLFLLSPLSVVFLFLQAALYSVSHGWFYFNGLLALLLCLLLWGCLKK